MFTAKILFYVSAIFYVHVVGSFACGLFTDKGNRLSKRSHETVAYVASTQYLSMSFTDSL